MGRRLRRENPWRRACKRTRPHPRRGLRASSRAEGSGPSARRRSSRRAGVSKSTLYRHFRSKEELVLAFLQRREQRWTQRARRGRGRDAAGRRPREQLLAIFDVFDEWFHRDDFEGCSFINVLLEVGDLENPVGQRERRRTSSTSASVVAKLAEEAGIDDPEAFAHVVAHPHEGLDRRRRRRRRQRREPRQGDGRRVCSTGAWARRSSRSRPDASSIDAQGTENRPTPLARTVGYGP